MESYSNVAPLTRVFTGDLPGALFSLCSIAREHEVLEGDTAERKQCFREIPGKHEGERCYVM